MKKQLPTILITIALTTVTLIVAFVWLMPTIGPRYIMPNMTNMDHQAMMENMMSQHGMTNQTTATNTGRSRLSDNGLFQVSYESENLNVGTIHQWLLHVETADGQLVEEATITVDGGMPAHGHGLPTRPQVTGYLGNGDYLVEGMKFQMTGYWVVVFTIQANGQTDSVTFELEL